MSGPGPGGRSGPGPGGRSGPRRGAGAAALAALATVLVALGAAACGRDQPLVVVGATLIDGTGAPALPSARVVVVDGRIACVGGPDACPSPPGADVLEAGGFYLIPGLIDTEAGPDEGPDAALRARLGFLLGVTTAGRPPSAAGTDLIVRPGPVEPVPRNTLSAPSTGGSVTLEEVGAREQALAVRLAEELGARNVALEPRLLSRELEVASYQLPVGLNPLLELPLFVEAIRVAPPDRSPEEQRRARADLEAARSFVRAFHEAGGRLVTGSGGALAPGLAIHEELEALVAAGLAPEEALQAATRDAATALGLEDRGTIEVGKLADFLILEGDPRIDIVHTQLVSRVVKGGVLHDPVVVFEGLLREPGSRASAGRRRVLIGFGASLLAVLGLVWAAARHRKSLPSGWRA